MASAGFPFTPTENHHLRHCVSFNKFAARSPPPPLLSGETVMCEDDGFESHIENLEGETQVLVGDVDMYNTHSQLPSLEGDTQVVDHLDDRFEMPVINYQGETQVWHAYGGETQVDDAMHDIETQLVNPEGETEVQVNEDCVRTVCSQFLRNGIEPIAGGVANESGVVKDLYCNNKTDLVTETKLGHKYRKPVETDNNVSSSTPPSSVEVDPGYFQRSFTSIRAASLRTSGLAARFKALDEARNNSCHAPVEKRNESSRMARSPGSVLNHDVAEQKGTDAAVICETVSSAVKKLFNSEYDDEGNKTPDLSMLDNNDEVAGLSYVDSQEPGDSTQADALDFIERFVEDNAFDMQLEADNDSLRTLSKPAPCSKGFVNFPKKTICRPQEDHAAVCFDWDEEVEDEGGGDFFCRMKEKIFKESGYKHRSVPPPPKSRRCAKSFGDKSATNKSYDKNTAIHSDSKLLFLNSNSKGKGLETAEVSIKRNLEAELNGEYIAGCMEATANRSGTQEIFSVGPDTQLAAEAMEALLCGEPISGSDVNADQGNLASTSTVADSKSRPTSKMVELKKVASSDGLVLSKSKKKLNIKKKGRINGTTRKRKGVEEVNGTCTMEKKSCADDRVSPSTVAYRETRSMVLNQSSMLSNQANVALSKGTNSEANLQAGVVIPKGKRSRRCVGTCGSRHQSVFKDKSDRTYCDSGEVKLNDSILNEVSRSNIKTMGAESSSRKLGTSKQLSSRLVKSQDLSKLKNAKDGNKGSLHLRCNEGSTAKRSVANSAGTFCSHDDANINKDVLSKYIPDHHSAKETGADVADCSMAVETTIYKVAQSHKPPGSSCITPDDHSKIASGRMKTKFRRQLPVNLSRSSLRKEISALLSSTSKSLPDLKRKRREMNEVRLLFSHHLDDDVTKHQKKILARLGASLAFSISDATHFVADSFVRTRNMLEAIALGKPIVTHLWLESCNQTSCVIDEKAYILRDLKKERELGFSMPDILFRARQQPLLQNRKVIITPNSKPSKDVVAILVMAVHGRVSENCDTSSLEVDNYADDILILSCEEDYSFCQPFLDNGVKVYSSELLLSGIVTQRLDYERHRLFKDHVRTSVNRRSRSTRVCREFSAHRIQIGRQRSIE